MSSFPQVDEDWRDLIEFARSRSLLFDIRSDSEIEEAVFESPEKARLTGALLASEPPVESVAGETASCSRTHVPLEYEDLSDEEDTVKRKVERPKKNVVTTRQDELSKKSESTVADQSLQKSVVSKTDNNSGRLISSDAKNQGRFPHVHSDGTRCVEKCIKTKERAAPSGAYYKLPHIHADGLRCTDKCVRVEEREKRKRQMQQEAARVTVSASSETRIVVGDDIATAESVVVCRSEITHGNCQFDAVNTGQLSSCKVGITSTLTTSQQPMVPLKDSLGKYKAELKKPESNPRIYSSVSQEGVMMSSSEIVPKSVDRREGFTCSEANKLPRPVVLEAEIKERNNSTCSQLSTTTTANTDSFLLNGTLHNAYNGYQIYQPKVLLSNCLSETSMFARGNQPEQSLLRDASPVQESGTKSLRHGGLDALPLNNRKAIDAGRYTETASTIETGCYSPESQQYQSPDYFQSPNISLSSSSPQVLDCQSPISPVSPRSPLFHVDSIDDKIRKIRLSRRENAPKDDHVHEERREIVVESLLPAENSAVLFDVDREMKSAYSTDTRRVSWDEQRTTSGDGSYPVFRQRRGASYDGSRQQLDAKASAINMIVTAKAASNGRNRQAAARGGNSYSKYKWHRNQTNNNIPLTTDRQPSWDDTRGLGPSGTNLAHRGGDFKTQRNFHAPADYTNEHSISGHNYCNPASSFYNRNESGRARDFLSPTTNSGDSSVPHGQPNPCNLSKVDEITQRIRERNSLRSRGAQLISADDSCYSYNRGTRRGARFSNARYRK